MHWYDVALWRRWPYDSADFPAYVGRVLAQSAISAGRGAHVAVWLAARGVCGGWFL